MDITIKHQYRAALYEANSYNAKRLGICVGDKIIVAVHGLFQVGDDENSDASFICEVIHHPVYGAVDIDTEHIGKMLYADPVAIQFVDGGPYK